MRPDDTSTETDEVVLRLGVTGDLGHMDFLAVLRALQGSYELLQRTAHRVLGDRADELRWQLAGLREGSAMTLLRASATSAVTGEDLRELVDTYTRDLRAPADRLPAEDLPVLREVLLQLQKYGVGSLVAQVDGAPEESRVVVEPEATLQTLVVARPAQLRVIGSVVGRLERLNMHQRREAALWNELDQRSVVVTFAEEFYQRVHGALRQRVEVFGTIVEDADGRPLRIRLQDLEVLASDENLPTLSSLVGSMPDITGGAPAQEYLARSRREFDLG
jgi:hypothetical protein